MFITKRWIVMEVFSFEQKDFTRQKKSMVGFVLR